ncbi:MAG: hypothetical protein AB1847_21025 [bacterium]
MKRWTLGIIILIVVLLVSFNSGTAQMSLFSTVLWPQRISSFLSPLLPVPIRSGFAGSSFPFYTPVPFPPLPLAMPSLQPSPLAPVLAPVSLPRPMIRNAAATITIIFNPALSVVNVSALPITALAPATAVPTTTLPTTTAPTIAPTALVALLPALLTSIAPAGPPYNQTQTLVAPAAPAPVVPAAPAAAAAKAPTATVLPGLTGLLPLI